MSVYDYDHLLRFELPDDFHILEETDDDGNPAIGIGVGMTVEPDGTVNYTHRLYIVTQDCDDDNEMGAQLGAPRLEGTIQNHLHLERQSQSFFGIDITLTTAMIFLIHEERIYALSSVLVGDGALQESWLAFMNTVLASVVLDGQKGEFAPITADMLDAACGDAEEEVESAKFIKKMGDATDDDAEEDVGAAFTKNAVDTTPFPVAIPDESQYTHWSFLENTKSSLGFLGGMVQINNNGTEYSFQELDEYRWEECDDAESLATISKVAEPFALAQTARDMGEIFRVSEDAFEGSEDREQEIDCGLIRRCGMYEAFRSFAWTLAAYCDKNQLSPAQVSIEEIEEIADFVVEQCDRLNYKANSFCPTLCSGDDIHNYYIPDATPAAAREALVNCIAEEEGENTDLQAHILSLDGLRQDMEFLFPAMQTIYDCLAETRDFDEPLEGPVAEVLYVWCSMTYALRSPVYTEDGPMTCFWAHPGEMPTLKPFGKVVRRPVDCGYAFTYEQGNTYENERYSFQFPDGFVIKVGAEDRDFIAYLPNENDPDDYIESPFIIYAGQVMDSGVNSQLKLPLTYHAVLSRITAPMPGAIPWHYHRRALPGVIAAIPDSFCLHANAAMAYDETVQIIRFQIGVSSKKQALACEALIKSMLDRMTPKHLVTILDDIDDAAYVNMTMAPEEIEKWSDLLVEYANQIVLARNQQQEQVVNSLQSNNPGLSKTKKILRDMLCQYADAAAECLQKADAIYQLKRAQFPNDAALQEMKQTIDEALLSLVVQFVNLDGERIESVNPYKAIYERHDDMTAEQAVADVLATCSDVLSDAAVAALKGV